MRAALFVSLLVVPVLAQAQEPVEIGTRRELFVDGLLIDKLDGQVFFDGRFSFYEDKQPYAHLNVETARVRFGARHGMTLLDEFAYAEASDSLKPFRYWFRRDAGGDGLLLVGYFGYQHTILCTLDRHAD